MSNGKCSNCGCTEIEVDSSRGESICTRCGSVLEANVIVSEIQYEENAHGGSSVIGQFVSADSKGVHGIGTKFHTGIGKESRELTLQNARRSITNVAQQLRLNSHCIDIAFNFYKMALNLQLTRGRKHPHVIGACVYITCRTEGTSHMLIDLCDALQVSVYELGRSYLRISKALCIKIPFMDPSLYVLRFCSCLGFGDKTHEVSMTALRLVQRMKKDSIHSGRRPSGLCGAALLIAARLHDFNRTVNDIIKIVKVHETTLKKRLLEFGETPSSALTLDEFMTVDLEEEQDPPSFRAARNQDKEKLQKMLDDELLDDNFKELQQEIEKELEERVIRSTTKRKRGKDLMNQECEDTEKFITESTMNIINENLPETEVEASTSQGLGPNIESFGLAKTINECMEIKKYEKKQSTPEKAEEQVNSNTDDFDDLDDDEINSYIMSEVEADYKANLWTRVNAEYLKQQKEKEEKLAKEKEEGKPEKKRRKTGRKNKANGTVAKTAGEAIEKMLQEKKLSSKINYDVLRNLDIKSEIKVDKKEPKTEGNVSVEALKGNEEESSLKINDTSHPNLESHDSDGNEDDFFEDEAGPDESLSLAQMLHRQDDHLYDSDDGEYDDDY